MRKMMYCKDKHSKLLCLVENEAISDITWHPDGVYIYVDRKCRDYEEVYDARAYCIKCNWTKTEYLEETIIEYLKTHDTTVILYDGTIYDEEPDSIKIGF